MRNLDWIHTREKGLPFKTSTVFEGLGRLCGKASAASGASVLQRLSTMSPAHHKSAARCGFPMPGRRCEEPFALTQVCTRQFQNCASWTNALANRRCSAISVPGFRFLVFTNSLDKLRTETGTVLQLSVLHGSPSLGNGRLQGDDVRRSLSADSFTAGARAVTNSRTVVGLVWTSISFQL